MNAVRQHHCSVQCLTKAGQLSQRTRAKMLRTQKAALVRPQVQQQHCLLTWHIKKQAQPAQHPRCYSRYAPCHAREKSMKRLLQDFHLPAGPCRACMQGCILCHSSRTTAGHAPRIDCICLLILRCVQMDREKEQRRALFAWRHARGRRRGDLSTPDRKGCNRPYVACSARQGSRGIQDAVARSISKDRSIFMHACQLYMADILLHMRHAS